MDDRSNGNMQSMCTDRLGSLMKFWQWPFFFSFAMVNAMKLRVIKMAFSEARLVLQYLNTTSTWTDVDFASRMLL